MTASILGIDPGTRKAGYAVAGSESGAPLALGIEPVETLLARVGELIRQFSVEAIALGRGTNAPAVAALLAPLKLPVHLVDERDTTYRARRLYFADHPPRGWRRMIPLGLQFPPRPIDDYAALLIARRYLGQVE
jgi:RNase H-fold protein (predicted Holliday junction resolvase)